MLGGLVAGMLSRLVYLLYCQLTDVVSAVIFIRRTLSHVDRLSSLAMHLTSYDIHHLGEEAFKFRHQVDWKRWLTCFFHFPLNASVGAGFGVLFSYTYIYTYVLHPEVGTRLPSPLQPLVRGVVCVLAFDSFFDDSVRIYLFVRDDMQSNPI